MYVSFSLKIESLEICSLLSRMIYKHFITFYYLLLHIISFTWDGVRYGI